MDPFEVKPYPSLAVYNLAVTDRALPQVRMQFLSLINRLTSSLASIQKVSSFALKHGPKCADDIWDCLVEECDSVSLNARINLLYFLDTLLDKQGVMGEGRPYAALVKRDLAKVVDLVVPHSREGVLNLMAADQVGAVFLLSSSYNDEYLTRESIHFGSLVQVLRSWRTRRLLDADVIDPISAKLDSRRIS